MKRSLLFPPLLLAAGCFLAGLAKANANLITNGSFESPAGSPGFSSTRPDGWTGFGSFGSGLIHGPGAVLGGAFRYPDPLDGDQFVNIGTGDLTTQFVVTTPGDYVLKWHDNSLITGWNGSYSVDVKDSALASIVSTAYSYSYLTQSPPWRALSLELPGLAAGAYTLKFGPGTAHTFLDDVSVELKAGSAVPEAGSTAVLWGAAFLGLMFLPRRRLAMEWRKLI